MLIALLYHKKKQTKKQILSQVSKMDPRKTTSFFTYITVGLKLFWLGILPKGINA